MSMEILVHSEGFRLNDEVRTAVADKVGRLDHFGLRVLRARVTLRRISPRPSSRQFIAKVLMEVPGRDLTAEQKASGPIEAIDLLVEKMEQRLRKRKTAKLSRREQAPVWRAATAAAY